MEELWVPVKNYENYMVSTLGNIRSIKHSDSLLKQRNHRQGYKLVNLYKNGELKTLKVHRLVAIAFIPNIENLPEVNHKDGIKSNNRVDNLEWCTGRYNKQHGFKNGLFPREGEKNGRSKLTNTDVEEIYKMMLIQNKKPSEVVKLYKVTLRSICNIKDGRTWSHITKQIKV